jgi:hypothetical protein
MRKSVRVTLTIAAVGLTAGNRRRMDPCDKRSFDKQACQVAIADGAYYWLGSGVPCITAVPIRITMIATAAMFCAGAPFWERQRAPIAGPPGPSKEAASD